MKNQFSSKHCLFLIAFLLFNVSCQDDPVADEIDLVDEDMATAIQMADDYLKSASGRNGTEKSITVLKYKDDQLWFATNTDDVIGYQEVTEDTYTAYAEPGEHIFWYSGGGLTDLDQIEFDNSSQSQLDDFPEEINADKMWIITIPHDVGNNSVLKYDIVYDFKGHNGPPIRLDPKIKIAQ